MAIDQGTFSSEVLATPALNQAVPVDVYTAPELTQENASMQAPVQSGAFLNLGGYGEHTPPPVPPIDIDSNSPNRKWWQGKMWRVAALGALVITTLTGGYIIGKRGNEEPAPLPPPNPAGAAAGPAAEPKQTTTPETAAEPSAPEKDILEEKGVFFGFLPEEIKNYNDVELPPEDQRFFDETESQYLDLQQFYDDSDEHIRQSIEGTAPELLSIAMGTCVIVERQLVHTKTGEEFSTYNFLVNPIKITTPDGPNMVTYASVASKGRYVNVSLSYGENEELTAAWPWLYNENVTIVELPEHHDKLLYLHHAMSQLEPKPQQSLEALGFTWQKTGYLASPEEDDFYLEMEDYVLVSGIAATPANTELNADELEQAAKALLAKATLQ